MKPRILQFLCVCTIVLLVAAWTKEDYEIFKLRDEVEASEGLGTTFYDFVGVKSSATYEDVTKALKRKSKALHPDKAKHSFVASRSTGTPRKPGDKKKGVHVSKGPSEREIQRFLKSASERYSRLGVVANILKGPARERYDYFLSHGFPAWRGTGYYYSRYRPGLGTVLLGLFLAGGGGAHYFALTLTYRNQVKLMQKYQRYARKSAWGDESGLGGIPGLGAPVDVPAPEEEELDPLANLNRKQRREYEKHNKKEKNGKSKPARPTPPAATPSTTEQRRRVNAENGKVFSVSRTGDVYLEEEDEDGEVQEYLLDSADIPKPTIWDTAVIRMPIWLYRKVADPFLKDTKPVSDAGNSLLEVPEVVADAVQDISISAKNSSLDKMSSSMMSDFEMIDSTGIDSEAGQEATSTKKRSKKSKK